MVAQLNLCAGLLRNSPTTFSLFSFSALALIRRLRQVPEGYRTWMGFGMSHPVDAYQIEEQGCSSRLWASSTTILHSRICCRCVS